MFLRKHLEEGIYQVSAVSASDVLKRNTDSLRCATSWKWGGKMNNKCIYYVEGSCEQQLIAVLKEAPERLIPGKIKVFNVVQNLIPKSQMSENHFFPQVLNLEDELVRCTDVRTAMELTKSGSVKNFKTDFCKMKAKDCRSMLERHKLG